MLLSSVSADGETRPCGISDCIVASADGAEPVIVLEAAVTPAQSAEHFAVVL